MIRRPVVVAGARPNFVKVAPLMRAFASRGIDASLVHTGQHYDALMSDSFFESLGIPEPVANLGVGSGSHGVQTAGVMVAFEQWLEATDADAVLVVGDVNSTVACALVAAKCGIRVGHVEAGLRSFDRSMPEEVNRVAVDAIAGWLFTPSVDADANLLAEGVHPDRIFRVGNVMVDSLLGAIEQARARPVRDQLGLPDRYGLVTLHRPALVDNPDRMREVMRTLREVAASVPLVFPVHPRTRAMLDRMAVDTGTIRLVDPQVYLDFLALEAGAALVLTDSGGVQEETTVLGVPCLTLRENTERPITITHGTNRLVGFDHEAIVDSALDMLERPPKAAPIENWDGRACERIVDVVADEATDPSFVPPALERRSSPEFRAGQSPLVRSSTGDPDPHITKGVPREPVGAIRVAR
jgi:UDP-N-acetylglucosamine 2-epimerase (non-hydrolysing)